MREEPLVDKAFHESDLGEIGKSVSEHIRQEGINLSQFAKDNEISKSTMSRIMRDGYIAKSDTLAKVLRGLKLQLRVVRVSSDT